MGKNLETHWANRAESCRPEYRAGRDLRESRRERSEAAKRERSRAYYASKYGYR